MMPLSCGYVTNLNYVWSMIPYWWRFWQCIHRVYYENGIMSQRYNAFKYFISFMAGFCTMMYKLTGGQFVMGTNQWSNWYITFFCF